MANLISLTSFTTPSNVLEGKADGATASAVLINVNRIVSVKTRATAYLTTGITDVVYDYRINGVQFFVALIVTEARAAILTSANANAVAT